MAKWKLCRQIYGSEEFRLSDGDKVTIGRGLQNDISLSSAVVSRNHSIIHVQTNNALITDLQSSNGVWIGTNKIPPNKPYVIGDSDVIGFGWAQGASLVNINDHEKYIFKLTREKSELRLPSRIQYQSDNEIDDIKTEIALLNQKSEVKSAHKTPNTKSPQASSNLSLKRKLNNNIVDKTKEDSKEHHSDVIINISDSDSDINGKVHKTGGKKPKLEAIDEDPQKQLVKEAANKNEFVEYDAFNVKQELLGYDDEAISIDDESDSESEHWLLRLSQNSPGKPFTKVAKLKSEVKIEDNSYSQLDDDFISHSFIFENDETFEDDLIKIVHPANEGCDVRNINKITNEIPPHTVATTDSKEVLENNILIDKPTTSSRISEIQNTINRDEPDGLKQLEQSIKSPQNELFKKAQMIEPLAQLPKVRSARLAIDTKTKNFSKHGHSKVTKGTPKKDVRKEERKKKLKEIATKDKEIDTANNKDSTVTVKPVINVKVTTSNRGAFLSNTAQEVVKPLKGKNKNKDSKCKQIAENLENRTKDSKKSNKKGNKILAVNKSHDTKTAIDDTKTRVPLKSIKPLTDSEGCFPGKPVSVVGPMKPEKPKKKVRFSDTHQIKEFVIEPGNRMTKTSLVKTTLVDIRQSPMVSLEKITLMKILRWNPQWLEEQLNNNDPPPILGHNNTPMTLFHSFADHNQYVQFVGDLLLMEIWEYITIGYIKTQSQHYLQMVVETQAPIPSQERYFDLISLNVSVSLYPPERKNLPRFGEIMHVTFGPENAGCQRFFYVHNVRLQASPPGQSKHYYSISLYATMTEKLKLLIPGEKIFCKSLAYVNNELTLFEAMENLNGSPLRDAILKPNPQHFINCHLSQALECKSQWTETLNPSQLKAVKRSVAAALGDKPSIQMVQGPPGTGKSSVICAIVMTYFYNAEGKKQQNRAKILICATSNAAVDGLVIRLLNLRRSLPQPERFRMVRVGREESMHPSAANVSSQQLAQRDLARIKEQPVNIAGLDEEISRLEAKINMWKTAMLDAKDPQRVAYCQGRVTDFVKRINLVRSGAGCGNDDMRLVDVERRIIEYADIVVTTLASAHNNKMKILKGRIALCIIDEAGQVIEPETLIPLTLDVMRLTLIGDPQQLPGFICSQRAKRHGLSESLFSRLSSCADEWPELSPVVLLDQQYRMHPDIADYPSRAFYGGMVRTVQPARPENLWLPPYGIISISSGDKGQGISGANEMEAWGVTRLVMALDSMLRPLKLNVAVITPYNAHKDLIKKLLRILYNNSEPQVEVNTVDSFQGQERDVVVVSLARSQGVGFLTDAGRMNVMLTRAKHALLICLNPFALNKNQQWRTLIDDAQRRKMYTNLPRSMCQPITAEQVANDDILKYIVKKPKRKRSRH